MKLLYSIFAALIMVSCGSGQMTQTPFAPTTAERIGEMMNYLASNDLNGREAGSEGIEMAAVYIENYFKSYGLTPYFESYRDTLSNFQKPSYNLVGMIEGNDPELKDEFILIGAHYDHIGVVNPENGDAIANGANDNASGTISVLEMARYFGTQKTNKRSLIFALFSAEEKGLLGSKHLAKKLKEEGLNLYTMLNFEMTGVPMQDKDYLMYITGYEMSNLAEVSNTYAGENLVGFLPTAKEFNLYQRSDNYPFHQEFGVPSHTFCTFDFTNFAYYHKPGDEAGLMDFEHMSTVVNKTIPVIEKIANAADQEIKLN
ncbi:M28 family metallopeptidase [Flagellimonas sp.]|uniref:M28 family metallopeptidase n=1 Tax=Flagellimonas sp. TaxID=2058762 RepID=UPI003BA88ACF